MYNNDFTIIPTSECDMNCEFCHENKKRNNIYLSNENINIFLEKIIKKIDKEKGIPISLFGGEPLLNKGSLFYLSNHKYAKYIDLRIFTNLNNFVFDDLYILSNFKKVTISTNLNIFENKLFYKTEKYKLIKYLIENTNIQLEVHCIISKKTMSNILDYAPKIKMQIEYIKKIKLKLSLIFPEEKDYTIDDFVNLITFYNYINDNEIFDLEIHKTVNLIYFVNKKIKQKDKCNINECNELTLNPDGIIIPCRRFYNYKYSKKEIKEIEKYSKKCNNCIFNSYCDVCKYNYYGTNNIILKCNRIKNILKAIETVELKGLKKIDTTLFTLSITVGNKCNKNCYFCYVDKKNTEEIDLNKLEKFIKNNYWKIKDLDTLIGGEPLLYLNEKYDFLKKYFNELHIISNIYIENEYVKRNSDFIKITASIQDEYLNKLKIDYYNKNIENTLVLLNNEVLNNIFETIKFLELNKLKYRFIELYSYKKGDNLINKKNFKNILKIKNIFKNIKLASLKQIHNSDCIYEKINIDKNKITVCGTLYYGAEVNNEHKKYIISNDLNNYIINKKDIEKIIYDLKYKKNNICVANKYCIYENVDILKKISEV